MTRATTSLWVLLVLGAGCGDFAVSTDEDFPGAGASDASTRSEQDAQAPLPPPELLDAALGPPDAGPTGNPEDAGNESPSALDDLRGDWAACGDRAVDADGETDCASSACTTAPLCCADRAACCVAGAVGLYVPFEGCFGPDPDACFGELQRLGDLSPDIVTDGGATWLWLASAGDAYLGLASSTLLEPSSGIDVGLDVITRGGCVPGACEEMVGIGLAGADVTRPDGAAISAVLSVSTGQLLLLSGGEVLRRATLSGTDGSMGHLALALDASGTATASFAQDGRAPVSLSVARPALPASQLRVVAFGRGDNGREAHILVRDLVAGTTVCDRPAAWSIAPVAITNARTLPTPWTALAVGEIPGDGEIPARRRLILEAGGRLFGGVVGPDGVTIDEGEGGALTGTYADGASGPESLGSLVWHASASRWELFLGRGGRDIVRIPSSDGSSFDRALAEVVLSAATAGAASIGQPSVAIDFRGFWTLVFQGSNSASSTWIGSAQSFDGTLFVLDDDAIAPSELPAAFDRDAVESPTVVVYNELVHVYYAGRRGVARSLGLVRRTAMGGWERYAGGLPVLEPGAEPWRSFGVGAPAALFSSAAGAGTGALDVYFLATGASVTLQRAHREVPRVSP